MLREAVGKRVSFIDEKEFQNKVTGLFEKIQLQQGERF